MERIGKEGERNLPRGGARHIMYQRCRRRMGAIILLASPGVICKAFQPTRRALQNFAIHQRPKSIATLLYAASEAKSKQPTHRRNKKRRQGHAKEVKNPNELETWRIYGVDVNPDALGSSTVDKQKDKREIDTTPPEISYLTPPVLSSLLSRLRIKSDIIPLPPQLKDARVVRRSLDARRRKGSDPKYTYVIDVTLSKSSAAELKLSHQPGRIERLGNKQQSQNDTDSPATTPINKQTILIVGAGPAGLFCALSLAASGLFTPIILERGQPVEARGKSIGALIHRRSLDGESNFSFGEGGAGTWSDGKLTTRIGRNSGPVRFVLETLVKYGAPKRILVEGSPHLGTDNLVRLLRNMREDLRSMGGEIHFGAKVNKFHIQDGTIKGVNAKCTPSNERKRENGDKGMIPQKVEDKAFSGDAVVLASGHSARDVYQELHNSGVGLEAKGFAVGFRIEHPQSLINEIQYGEDWGGRALTGRLSTDNANTEHFANTAGDSEPHVGTLPVASYRLATNEAWDGESNRGAYSFCQCPGGQIVPSSTEDGELCINGMSFSKRDSLWANSALVVTVSPDDPVIEPYQSHGSLAGLEFQRDMERRAYVLGGGDMRAPGKNGSCLLFPTILHHCLTATCLLGSASTITSAKIDRFHGQKSINVCSIIILQDWCEISCMP